MIKALPEILNAGINTRLIIVGDGPLLNNLKKLTERLKLRNTIVFTGFRSDLKKILAAIDTLVVPSLLEGFPMIFLLRPLPQRLAFHLPLTCHRLPLQPLSTPAPFLHPGYALFLQ